ncbi:hypothetical protein [Myxococcus sp. RHSTA-1-4]|uniref:hypothetical protein n=1 Tax=Myxococcus sp. RHSTA-1-4 TaxID=2874601 RepID=UPI001CBCF7EA|nr:hypothetical protein [Myxococcus sp. RHSTA-1-4]MBZ4416492.1 hypothetical protein [Myxococcus sp. RHSTA-1-4]
MTRRFRQVAGITLLGLAMRLWGALAQPMDYDEPFYLGAGLDYARLMRDGRWADIPRYTLNMEHPAFFKLVYGAAIASLGPVPEKREVFQGNTFSRPVGLRYGGTARGISVLFGTLAVLVLALAHPLAGLALALHPLGIKYTSQIYLEALPLLTSLLVARYYLRWREAPPGAARWGALGLSGFFLGMTAASKFVYCVVGLVVVAHAVGAALRQRRGGWWRPLLAWGVLSLATFLALNPVLWPAPLTLLSRVLDYHVGFSQGGYVQARAWPVWQPLAWLAMPLGPAENFLYGNSLSTLRLFNVSLTALALLGLPRLFQRDRFHFVWLVMGLVVVLSWPTKWAQYLLILIVPLCVSAGHALEAAGEWLERWEERRVSA